MSDDPIPKGARARLDAAEAALSDAAQALLRAADDGEPIPAKELRRAREILARHGDKK